jgi:hypothetical protein
VVRNRLDTGRTLMHDLLEREIEMYKRRTPKSSAAHLRAEKRIPLGVTAEPR